MPDNSTHSIAQSAISSFAEAADLTVRQFGAGRPVLLLHGGAGPGSVMGLAQALAVDHHVIVPVHPGFDGTSQQAGQRIIPDLAHLYSAMLDGAGLRHVLVIGSSMGGWIAAEIALLAPVGVSGYVLIDAAGIAVPGEPVLDVFFSIPPTELPKYSFHNPESFRDLLTKQTPAQQAFAQSNRAALAIYAGSANMQAPALRGRLAAVTAPVLVVWGDSDRVITPAYGRAYADAFPHARFELIAACGHLPQIEQPAALERLLEGFERELGLR